MPSKAELNVVRFAVGTPQNLQSLIWRMWVQGDEVYIGARNALTSFKVSLHKSNIWRIAFVAELEREDKDSDRVIIKWNRPEEFAPGWTTSIGILVSSVQAQRPFGQENVNDTRVKWFALPKEGKKLLFKVLFSHRDYSEAELKRISAEHDQVAARMLKKNGEVVWLIVREDDLSPIELQKIRDVMTDTKVHLKAGSSEDSLTWLRALSVISEDIPTASAQPTILDIPLGLENMETA